MKKDEQEKKIDENFMNEILLISIWNFWLWIIGNDWNWDFFAILLHHLHLASSAANKNLLGDIRMNSSIIKNKTLTDLNQSHPKPRLDVHFRFLFVDR
jgi:hypothetical protein